MAELVSRMIMVEAETLTDAVEMVRAALRELDHASSIAAYALLYQSLSRYFERWPSRRGQFLTLQMPVVAGELAAGRAAVEATVLALWGVRL